MHFETFLPENDFEFEKIKEDSTPRPEGGINIEFATGG
jgi:hypothetical protein